MSSVALAWHAWRTKLGHPTLRVGSIVAPVMPSAMPTPKNSDTQPIFCVPGLESAYVVPVLRLVLLGASE